MSQHHSNDYPAYAASEKLADGAVHLAGIGAALIAITAFMAQHAQMISTGTLTGLTIYWVGLVAMLSISFCYHMTPSERLRPTLRRADHAAIFLKIAGTYTPFVVAIGTGFGYVILGLVWVLALFGAGTKLFMWRKPGRLNAALYLGLGWIGMALIWSIFQASTAAGWCAVAGGLLYSGGVVFFHWESLKFANAIWHGFVVVASGFFFASVWLCVTA